MTHDALLRVSFEICGGKFEWRYFDHMVGNGYYVRNYRSEEEVFNSIFPITRTSFTRGLKNLHESPELNALNKTEPPSAFTSRSWPTFGLSLLQI